jgi:2-C-methyl-D-erythritol 4-phosphate cytidylyltransferase
MKTDALITAAGKGRRMGEKMKKQFISLGGIPLLLYTLKAFEEFEGIEHIHLVLDGGDFEYCRREIIQRYGVKKVIQLVPGGDRRQDSVWNGLKAMEGHCDTVIVHDAILKRLLAAMEDVQAVVTAIPAQDTIKRVDGSGNVLDTLQRNTLFHIQTPQGFRYDVITEAYKRAIEEEIWDTDDAYFVERMGIQVRVIEGSSFNIKITTPEDIALAHCILKAGSFDWRIP